VRKAFSRLARTRSIDDIRSLAGCAPAPSRIIDFAEQDHGKAARTAGTVLADVVIGGLDGLYAPGSLCSDNKSTCFDPQTFASRAALWCNALTSDEGLGLITPQVANRSGLRH